LETGLKEAAEAGSAGSCVVVVKDLVQK